MILRKITLLSIIICTYIIGFSQADRVYISDVHYSFNNSEFIGPMVLDTFYYDDMSIKAIGYCAITRSGENFNKKVGLWSEFYRNGILKSKGYYRLEKFLNCCSSGPCWSVYSYKVYDWVYFYDTGEIKAKGSYDRVLEKVQTNCCGGDRVFRHRLNKDWKFYNVNGEYIKLKRTLKKDLEEVERFDDCKICRFLSSIFCLF